MQQIEIQYFFPLTEQVPLELDYTESIKHYEQRFAEKYKNISSTAYDYASTHNLSSIIPSSVVLDFDKTIYIQSKEKPSLIRRLAYKALGVNWKQKN